MNNHGMRMPICCKPSLADEPQETGIRLDQRAVLVQGCRGDREHRLQFA